MRGPLWRGWLWTPRIWLQMAFRRSATWVQGRTQEEQRMQAARPAAPARQWPVRWLWSILATIAVVLTIWWLAMIVLPLVEATGLASPPAGLLGGRCGESADWCGPVVNLFDRLAWIAVAFVVFYLFTQHHVRRWYDKMARRTPEKLVTTSHDELAGIVGRDEMCEVLIERIRDPHVRCPIVLIGGVGAGKSAVLVKLTHELSTRGVVPIPLRLHDVSDPDKLDFEGLAKQRFQEVIDARLYSDAQAGRLWRQLRWSNQIAVLADGLEELGGDNKQGQRDSVLREAFTKAARDGLPLVVAARPYEPLRSMPAVVLGLEPLSEGTALAYGLTDEARRARSSYTTVGSLIVAADVTESPLYLKVIRDLNKINRLPQQLHVNPEPGAITRPPDRATVRWNLLEAWRTALVDGYLCEDFVRTAEDRAHALVVAGAFACVGFLHDKPTVSYDDLTDRGRWTDPRNTHHCILRKLRGDLGGKLDPTSRDDLAAAATEASELGVVQLAPDGLRFHHAVIQAYLGVEFLADPGVWKELMPKLIRPEPSHEFLIALTLLSRRLALTAKPQSLAAHVRAVLARPPRPSPIVRLVSALQEHARGGGNPCWRLEMYETALEIDVSALSPAHDHLVADIEAHWDDFQEQEAPDRPLDEAKLALVRVWGNVARLVAYERGTLSSPVPGPFRPPPYDSLFRVASREGSYRVRLAAAREIGLGGRAAALSLTSLGGLGPRLLTADVDEQARHEQQLRGWIAPLLHLSAVRDVDGAESAVEATRAALRAWTAALAARAAGDDRGLGLTSEIALAQGFRLAANVRQLPIGRSDSDRSFLVEMTEDALRHSRFWYSHLALIQALTLLSLPMDPGDPLPSRGHGANPVGLVQRWLHIAGSGVTGRERCVAHPFLLEVGRLCVNALITRRPERYCWIDEGETASRVGSCSTSVDVRRIQRLWVPDSMGWSVLDRRAERLLADVMLLMNLADRGKDLTQQEERLSRADRCDLPPCLTHDRSAMEPDRSLHSAELCVPGGTCLDDCPFRLCPLPAKGEPLRYKMDQNFCGRQADLASFHLRLTRAPWQGVARPGLREFWRQLSERELPKWRRW